MNRCQDVLTNHTLVQHDGILVVVTLPRHVGHEQVATQGQFAVGSGIALSQDIAFLHTLTAVAERTQVDGHVLVRATELRQLILLDGRFETNKLLVLRTVVQDTNGRSVNILNHTVAFGCNHCAGILADLLLNTCAHDRSLCTQKRNSLTHHVRTHQCTVGVVVLEERNERSGNRGNLLRSHIDKVHL